MSNKEVMLNHEINPFSIKNADPLSDLCKSFKKFSGKSRVHIKTIPKIGEEMTFLRHPFSCTYRNFKDGKDESVVVREYDIRKKAYIKAAEFWSAKQLNAYICEAY